MLDFWQILDSLLTDFTCREGNVIFTTLGETHLFLDLWEIVYIFLILLIIVVL